MFGFFKLHVLVVVNNKSAQSAANEPDNVETREQS